MTNKDKDFKIIEFKSQRKINEENRLKIELKRNKLQEEVESIWNNGK